MPPSFLIAGLSAHAATNPQADVILSYFHNSYHYAKNVTIKEVDGLYRVDFMEEGRPQFAYYNASGEMVVNAEIREKSDLSPILQKQLDTHYSKALVTEVYVINSESGSTYFAVIVQDGKRNCRRVHADGTHSNRVNKPFRKDSFIYQLVLR